MTLYADVSANPLASLAIGIIFDGSHELTAILFDPRGQVSDDKFVRVVTPIIDRGLHGAKIGSYDDLRLTMIYRDAHTHPSSTDCEMATFEIAKGMTHDTIVGDSAAVEKMAMRDGVNFTWVPGHGNNTPTQMKVVDRLSRKILRALLK